MTKLLYILILVGAVSFTAWISASGEFDAGIFTGECRPVANGTITVTPTTTPSDTPEVTPEPTKQKCNQGIGNGTDGCDPGNSNHNQPSNDERGRKPGTPGPRGR